MTLKNSIPYIIIALLVVALFWRKDLPLKSDVDQISTARTDTLRNEPDGSVSKAIFAAEDVEMLRRELAVKDAKLAEMVKKGAKTGIKTVVEWRIDTVVVNADSIRSDIRNATVKTKDYTANITSWPDSTRMALSAVDTVRYSIGKDFRLNANHSFKGLKVVELESFYVKPQQKKTGWKFFAGAVLGGLIVYGAVK